MIPQPTDRTSPYLTILAIAMMLAAIVICLKWGKYEAPKAPKQHDIIDVGSGYTTTTGVHVDTTHSVNNILGEFYYSPNILLKDELRFPEMSFNTVLYGAEDLRWKCCYWYYVVPVEFGYSTDTIEGLPGDTSLTAPGRIPSE